MSSQQKNILLLIPNLDFGGAQQSFVLLSNELAKKHRVINVVFNKHNIAPYDFTSTLIDLNVPASRNLLGKAVNFLKRLLKVRTLKKQHDVQVSISFLEGADYVNLLTRRKDKVILSVRGSKKYDQDITGWLGLFRLRILLPLLYSRADYIVALNEGIRQELTADYKLKVPIRVIYNGFSVSRVVQQINEPLDEAAENLFQWPVLISHGRLAPEKGLEEFLAVIAVLKKRKVSCKFLILGEGPVKDKLQQRIVDHQLKCWLREREENFTSDADVYFWGYQQNPFKFLAHSKLFVLPSLHEGFGNSLAEAMLCGIPVLATDCPYSPRELLAPGSTAKLPLQQGEWADFGVLLPQWHSPEVVEQWVNIITDLLNSEEKRQLYGAKAKERISFFSIEKTVQGWNDLIDEVA